MSTAGAPSIATLTMNPALDITTETTAVIATEKMRCGTARYDPGGGGINVARVAHILGADVAAVFPIGGTSGAAMVDQMQSAAVPFDSVPIGQPTRESFTVNEERTGQQYRFVLPGPTMTVGEQAKCLDALRRAAASARFIVASGSLPPGVTADCYQQVADISTRLGALFVLDTSGRGLTNIRSDVFLLKTSIRELRECVNRDLAAEAAQVAAARELITQGRTRVVVVSRGADGALLVTAEGAQRFLAIPVQAVSGVGAGDALVAGTVVGLNRGWPLDKSLRLGIAAGTAMLLTPGTAVCNRADVERLFEIVAEPVAVE